MKKLLVVSMVLVVTLFAVSVLAESEGAGRDVAAYGSGSLTLSNAYIPDPAFREYLSATVDTDGDGTVYLPNITSMSVSGLGISSLEGIEYFENLTRLTCRNNPLTSLDLSHNPNLEYLDLQSNQLTEINLTKNQKLKELQIENNPITSIDLRETTGLVKLNCSGTQLSEIHTAWMLDLEHLICRQCPNLTSLNLKHNTALKGLICDNSSITSLDLSGCTALGSVSCSFTPISSLIFGELPSLTSIACYDNNLTELDVTGCPNLTFLNATCPSTRIDLSKSSKLEKLILGRGLMTELDVSGCPSLKMLRISQNQLSSLDVSKNPHLMSLWVYANKLKTLDISGCAQLIECVKNSQSVKKSDLFPQPYGLTNYICWTYDSGSFDANDLYVDEGIILVANGETLYSPEPPVTEAPAVPTANPTATQKPTDHPTPTAPSPTPATPTPSPEPTMTPTAEPIVSPTAKPTETTTVKPTTAPTEKPTSQPAPEPTEEPEENVQRVTVNEGIYDLYRKEKVATFVSPVNMKATKVVIPDTIKVGKKTYKVTKIASLACSGRTMGGMANLKTVSIGKNVKEIGTMAFFLCDALKEVSGGKGVKIIKSMAFQDNSKLKTLPEFPALETIGTEAFADCKALVSISLGKKVKEIGSDAFKGCKSLKKITIKTTKLTNSSVDSNAFSGINTKATVTCPANSLKNYKKLLVRKGLSKKIKITKK